MGWGFGVWQFERQPHLTQTVLRQLLIEECDKFAAGVRGPGGS
jgi:hypothetical protein